MHGQNVLEYRTPMRVLHSPHAPNFGTHCLIANEIDQGIHPTVLPICYIGRLANSRVAIGTTTTNQIGFATLRQNHCLAVWRQYVDRALATMAKEIHDGCRCAVVMHAKTRTAHAIFRLHFHRSRN
jgi:hypothetical protein